MCLSLPDSAASPSMSVTPSFDTCKFNVRGCNDSPHRW
ncbi:MAG: hypothetical protein OJF55_000484 [Rhodanobacteraceae bacterium]|nr:MAG: hypothetical protein OJF55_000484 [Rhodanobacteraceae bacterium]